MKNYFSENTDRKRIEKLQEIKEKFEEGKIDLQDARKQLKEQLGKVRPLEIAAAEQELTELREDQCQVEDMHNITDLFEDLMDMSPPELPKDHPIAHYYAENEYAKKLMKSIEDLVQYPVIKNQWYELYDELKQIRIHYSRKQNQLYPVLEKKGFDRPTTTMWTFDDYIRDEIRDCRELLDRDEEAFIEAQKTLVEDVLDLIDKEESILYPTSLEMISREEFEEMKEGDQEIGFAWIQVDKAKKREMSKKNDSEFMKDLNLLLSKHQIIQDTGELDVSTGKLTLEQINLIYQHMPVDLSYVDENEIVKFYTDTKHRVFPRSKNVIGRDVKNCHPRNSVHIVKEIVEKFRNKEESEVEFWINNEDLFIYIKYIAVHDDEGNFRGILEMMQDCTHIRSLEGSQTLLSWSEEGNKEIQEDQEKVETQEQAKTKETNGETNITKDTRLKGLLVDYPGLKEYLPQINPSFKMLQSPLAKVMIPKATVEMMAERSGMEVDVLIEKIEKYIINKK
ncbi:MAG: PAS domain-containing protein [Tissierellia bacterium]|nr:PAS domain-containing protein [Tissierellia bacterium]